MPFDSTDIISGTTVTKCHITITLFAWLYYSTTKLRSYHCDITHHTVTAVSQYRHLSVTLHHFQRVLYCDIHRTTLRLRSQHHLITVEAVAQLCHITVTLLSHHCQNTDSPLSHYCFTNVRVWLHHS